MYYILGIITGILICVFLKKSQNTIIYQKAENKINSFVENEQKGEIIDIGRINQVFQAKSPTEFL